MGVDEDKRATLRRFAAVGAAGPLARLAGGDSDDDDGASGSDVRDAITGYLARTPGAHFSKLRDDLQLGTGKPNTTCGGCVRTASSKASATGSTSGSTPPAGSRRSSGARWGICAGRPRAG